MLYHTVKHTQSLLYHIYRKNSSTFAKIKAFFWKISKKRKFGKKIFACAIDLRKNLWYNEFNRAYSQGQNSTHTNRSRGARMQIQKRKYIGDL